MRKSIIIIISFIFIGYYANSEEMSNKDLSTIVNKFLCSDDINKMSDMVEYPVFVIKETNLFDEYQFLKGVIQASSEEGIYKLGKKCIGFQWDHVLKMKHRKDGYLVIVKSSINGDEMVTVFINREGKITGFITD